MLPEPPGLMFFPQALLAVKSVSVDEDPESEVPTHPEDGASQPGNSKVSPSRGRMGRWQLVGLRCIEAGGANMYVIGGQAR